MLVTARSGLAGRLAWVFVGACLVFSIVAGFRHVRGAVPYPEHIDERYITIPAARVLLSESRDPKSYSYPSLPIFSVQLQGTLPAQSVAGDVARANLRERELRRA